MGFLSDLLSRGSIGTQGKDLAERFAKRLPKERTTDSKRVEAEFEILAGSALDLRRKSNLGVLGTSHLANSVQWALVDAGYTEEFARQIGSQLAVRLAAVDSTPTGR